MKKVYYPRVLIVGHIPGEYTGTSITLSNLFYGWPPDRLFVAATEHVLHNHEKSFSSYYKLGKKEIKSLWIHRSIITKSIDDDCRGSFRVDKQEITNLRYSKSYIYSKVIKPILHKTGLHSVRFNYSVSQELMEWIEHNEIDVILTMLGNVSTMKFAAKLKKFTGRKLAIFILDDWIHAHPKQTLFPVIWKYIYRVLFVQVVRLADIHIAISEKMSTEYEKEYHTAFHVFHNPVDISRYNIIRRLDHKGQSYFRICYLGKINNDTVDGLLDLIMALEMINDDRVVLDIYAGANAGKMKTVLSRTRVKSNIRVMPYIKNKLVPSVIMASNLLFLPLGFSKNSREYTRLSMPTKASEYMASRVPILLYAPACIALTEYAINDEWAITICEKNVDLLRKTVSDIVTGKLDTQKFVDNAFELTVQKHQADVVREEFRKVLAKPISDGV